MRLICVGSIFILVFLPAAAPGQAFNRHVDPFIGTDEMGHTYPGATVPFGFVQLSPETELVPYNVGRDYNPDAYRYCSGYQYDDSTIVGFAHTHFNGTGHSDVDGHYRGLDGNIHTADGFTNYTIFSLWDTYRAQHPLLTILQPERACHMIQSLIAHREQSVHGVLPVWSHHANENWCMIGYHSVSVMADAMGRDELARTFDRRAASRRNLFDANTGFLIVAENQAPGNVFVDDVWLHGKRLERSYITHDEIVMGGELRFVMSDRANPERGSGSEASPYSMSQ